MPLQPSDWIFGIPNEMSRCWSACCESASASRCSRSIVGRLLPVAAVDRPNGAESDLLSAGRKERHPPLRLPTGLAAEDPGPPREPDLHRGRQPRRLRHRARLLPVRRAGRRGSRRPCPPTLRQLIVAMSGSFDVVLDDGREQERFHLNRSYTGLYLAPMIWREIDNFSGLGVSGARIGAASTSVTTSATTTRFGRPAGPGDERSVPRRRG